MRGRRIGSQREQAQEHEERRQHHEGAWRRLERDEAILYERRAELERLRNSLPLVPETFVWDLDALAQLVQTRADEFPERAEEWRAYLSSLASARRDDGTLPRSVDALVWQVFEPLLEKPRLPFAL